MFSISDVFNELCSKRPVAIKQCCFNELKEAITEHRIVSCNPVFKHAAVRLPFTVYCLQHLNKLILFLHVDY